jgi:sulfur-oxidizing protein SoxY
MSTDVTRRLLLKRSLMVSSAIGAGILIPRSVLAAWPKEAFAAKQVPDALKALTGMDATTTTADIKIKAPDIAENGAVVPITVSTEMEGIESISIVAAANPAPLVASFKLGEGALGFVSTRIKMGKTGDVIGVVKAGGKLYSASKPVKVTIGGCGG